MLWHVDRAYCLLVYNARRTQTITQTTTMVPNSPYPNIVASSGSQIQNPDEPLCTVVLAMYVRFSTQSEQFVAVVRRLFAVIPSSLLCTGFRSIADRFQYTSERRLC